MTAASLASVPAPRVAGQGARLWLAPLALLAALAVVVAARWAATTISLDPLAVGATFGLALVVIVAVARGRALAGVPRGGVAPAAQARVVARAIVIGAAAGVALVAITVAGGITSGPLVSGLGRPAAPFLPWALVTLLVASGQELLLRGLLFDRVRIAGGTILAIAITTLAFALIHVPLYGWHVVPLDIAVGLVFAGLRLGTGTVAAPAAAHAAADLATWWL